MKHFKEDEPQYLFNKKRINMSKVAKFRELVRILEASGMNMWDARIEARKLLGHKVPREKRIPD